MREQGPLWSHNASGFQDIVVRTTETSTQNFLELLENADIAKHVRVIEVIRDRGKCGTWLCWQTVLMDI